MALCPSTTTGWKTRSDPGRWGAAIGCLRVHCAVVNAAAVMTLIQSAKLNRHDPYAYLKDVLTRLPTQKNNAIDELLPQLETGHT
jgi:hypothetical protein